MQHCFARKRNDEVFVFLPYFLPYSLKFTEIICISMSHWLNVFFTIFFMKFNFLAFS